MSAAGTWPSTTYGPDDRRVAGPERGRDAELGLDGRHVIHVLRGDLEPFLAEVVDPALAAPALGVFVDRDGDGARARGHGRGERNGEGEKRDSSEF